MPALALVRHGRPLVEPGVQADRWELDPAGYDDVWALRHSGRLPAGAVWFSSPEPKATATAQLLTDADVGVLDGLREHVRESTEWIDDFAGAVRQAFEAPEQPAHPGWEPLAVCRDRVSRAARGVLDSHPDVPVVLVGHGTAWTLLAAELTGQPPDLGRWEALQMPDVIVLDG